MRLSKISKRFFNYNFLGGIFLSLRHICSFEISKKFSIFFIPYMTYFKKKISRRLPGTFGFRITHERTKHTAQNGQASPYQQMRWYRQLEALTYTFISIKKILKRQSTAFEAFCVAWMLRSDETSCSSFNISVKGGNRCQKDDFSRSAVKIRVE